CSTALSTCAAGSPSGLSISTSNTPRTSSPRRLLVISAIYRASCTHTSSQVLRFQAAPGCAQRSGYTAGQRKHRFDLTRMSVDHGLEHGLGVGGAPVRRVLCSGWSSTVFVRTLLPAAFAVGRYHRSPVGGKRDTQRGCVASTGGLAGAGGELEDVCADVVVVCDLCPGVVRGRLDSRLAAGTGLLARAHVRKRAWSPGSCAPVDLRG